MLFGEESRHQVGNLDIVEVGKREMRVAVDADLRQVDDPCITAMAIDCIGPLFGHGKSYAPTILTGIGYRFLENEIAVVDDDGDAGELHELDQRNPAAFERACGTGHGWRYLALREDEAASRLVGDDGPDTRILHRGQPTHAAAVRVGHEDAGADPVEQGGNGIAG